MFQKCARAEFDKPEAWSKILVSAQPEKIIYPILNIQAD